jgi:hypothetical protein
LIANSIDEVAGMEDAPERCLVAKIAKHVRGATIGNFLKEVGVGS